MSEETIPVPDPTQPGCTVAATTREVLGLTPLHLYTSKPELVTADSQGWHVTFKGTLFESEPWEDIIEMVENLWLASHGYSSCGGQVFLGVRYSGSFYTYICTHMHISKHAHVHTCTPAQCTPIHVYMYTCTRRYMYTYTRAHLHTCTHTYMHTYTVHTYTCVYVHVHTYIHVHLHTCTSTHMHTVSVAMRMAPIGSQI